MKILNVGILFLLATGVFGVGQTSSLGSNSGKDTRDADGNCGLVYGKDHSLTICAPSGWTLDNGILNDQGIYAVFYPNGSSWQATKDSGTVMYVNVLAKSPGTSVAKMMADDASETRQNAPKAIVKEGEAIKVGGVSVQVQRFVPGDFNRYEAIAYIGEEKVLVMVAISSKNEKTFNQDYPKFVQLVQSYRFLSSNVNIERK